MLLMVAELVYVCLSSIAWKPAHGVLCHERRGVSLLQHARVTDTWHLCEHSFQVGSQVMYCLR